jgi:hypothetical protein
MMEVKSLPKLGLIEPVSNHKIESEYLSMAEMQEIV